VTIIFPADRYVFFIAGQGAGEKLKYVRLFRIIRHGGDYFKNDFI
jgi:hypothetical protein